MEPAQIPLKINMVVYTQVEGVRDIQGQWFVHFEGSKESMCFGADPHFATGDRVKITFEKVQA